MGFNKELIKQLVDCLKGLDCDGSVKISKELFWNQIEHIDLEISHKDWCELKELVNKHKELNIDEFITLLEK